MRCIAAVLVEQVIIGRHIERVRRPLAVAPLRPRHHAVNAEIDSHPPGHIVTALVGDVYLFVIADGDRNAFGIMARHYYAPLTVFASRLTGSREAAEDIVQDALVHVWERRRRLNDVGHMRNYLYLLVHNYSVDYFRAASKLFPLPGKLARHDEDVMAEDIRVETSRLLYAAIDSLPPRMAEIMRLTLEGMKQEDIAARMDIKVATVKAQKSEGIKKLQKALGSFSFILLYAF